MFAVVSFHVPFLVKLICFHFFIFWNSKLCMVKAEANCTTKLQHQDGTSVHYKFAFSLPFRSSLRSFPVIYVPSIAFIPFMFLRPCALISFMFLSISFLYSQFPMAKANAGCIAKWGRNQCPLQNALSFHFHHFYPFAFYCFVHFLPASFDVYNHLQAYSF